jgi:NAD(P)-dependent dehydrogenase (short-subunit alcohol dehydrogenase family)
VTTEREPVLPAETLGTAPGRGRLTGRRVLVVGAGQNEHGEPDPPIGNGRAIALLFAREGARVAVADRDQASADATTARITGEGGSAVTIVADMLDPAAPAVMVGAAAAALGGIDGVVYNVGIGEKPNLDGTSAATWDRVLGINLRGAMLTVQAAMPVLANGASIVFTSSTAGLKPGSRIPAYDASKAALGGLMRHGALEGAERQIRANVVAPGLMDTSLGRVASLTSRDRSSPSMAASARCADRLGGGELTN